MAKYKGKWEIKSWNDLVTAVADPTNDLTFRPKHRLPHSLQQGAKASKKDGGWFNRESITKTTDGTFDAGFYIYDSGSGLSYTGIPSESFYSDMDQFLLSSSISSGAYAQISESFFSASFPDIIIQIDEATTPASIANYTITPTIIGDTQNVNLVNTSTDCTSITIAIDGTPRTAHVNQVEYVLPMEIITFTANTANKSLKLISYSGSEYASQLYESASIYTPQGGSISSASLVGSKFGSGSEISHADYSYVGYQLKLKALGDGLDAIYDFAAPKNIIQFPTGTNTISGSFKYYQEGDTGLTGSYSNRILHVVAGTNSAIQYGTLGTASGSHVYLNSILTVPAEAGIYVQDGGSTGYLVPSVSLPHQVRCFNGRTY